MFQEKKNLVSSKVLSQHKKMKSNPVGPEVFIQASQTEKTVCLHLDDNNFLCIQTQSVSSWSTKS